MTEPPPKETWRSKWLRLDETVSPDVLKMAVTAEDFCRRFYFNSKTEPRLLVLEGPSGVGKSHTAKGILRWARACAIMAFEHRNWAAPPSSAYCDWSDVADLDRRDPDGQWQDICSADLLILEDIGAETDRYRSGATDENLRKLLELRAMKFTVVTTNIRNEDWSERWDARIDDRLHRNSEIIVVSAKSYWNPK